MIVLYVLAGIAAYFAIGYIQLLIIRYWLGDCYSSFALNFLDVLLWPAITIILVASFICRLFKKIL